MKIATSLAVRLVTLAGLLMLAAGASALMLEGVGHATVHNGDLESAREQARKAALRDLALQYETQVNSSDTLENGVLTQSRVQLRSRARASNIELVDEYRRGDLLRVTLRANMSKNQSCDTGAAATLRKRVAITGFPILYTDQARIGRIDDAGEILPQQLQAGLREQGGFQVFGATTLQLYADLLNAPTRQKANNRLSNVVELAREMGVQFVVTGVIRDLGVSDPAAWGSSVIDRLQRGIGAANQNRRFVADMFVYDGFSGAPIYQRRFATEARWDAGPGVADGFGSAGFQSTEYGRAVAEVIAKMEVSVAEALSCQPFMTRIVRVEGGKVTLDSGASAGLRPGDTLNLYRSSRSFDALEATPELQDSQTQVTLNNVHPDFSDGRISVPGGQLNIQRGDLAIVW